MGQTDSTLLPQIRMPTHPTTPMLPRPPKTVTTSTVCNSVDQMAPRSSATVLSLVEPAGAGFESGVVRRLAELGFLPGEIVTVLRRGPGGREPIAVQIGETVFALRRIEASCIKVESGVVAGQV